ICMCGRDVNQGWLALVWEIAEGIERFAIFPHIEQNATANRPKPRGRKGNTCEQPVDCIETLLEPSAITQPLRLVPLDLRVHRIKCDGTLEMTTRSLVLLAPKKDHCIRPMRGRVVGVERKRSFGRIARLFQRGEIGIECERDRKRQCLPSMRGRVAWIDRESTSKIGGRFGFPVEVAEFAALQEKVVRRPARRRLQARARGSRRYEPTLQGRDTEYHHP